MNQIEAFPLAWPLGYKRTPPHHRKPSAFKQTMDRAQRFLHEEIERLNGTGLVVSSNIPVRKDGMFYTDYMNRKMEDPGVAVYFNYNKQPVAMCCDKYSRVWENIYALGKGIEALRGMERWGVSDFISRAFTGFKAIPETTTDPGHWWRVMELEPTATMEQIEAAYRRLSKKYHPDAGGTVEQFLQLQTAFSIAKSNFK